MAVFQIWLPVMVLCIIADNIGATMFLIMLPFHLNASGVDATSAGLIFSTQAGAALAGDFLWGFLAHKFSPLPIIALIMLINTIAFLTCGFMSTLPGLIAIRGLAGFSRPGVPTESYVMSRTDLKSIKKVSTIINGFAMLSLMSGVLMGSALYDTVGWLGVNIVSSIIALVACLAVSSLWCHQRRHKPTTAFTESAPQSSTNGSPASVKQRRQLRDIGVQVSHALLTSHYVAAGLALWIAAFWIAAFNVSFTTFIMTVGRFNLTATQYTSYFVVLPICQVFAVFVGIPVSRLLLGYNKSLLLILTVHIVAQVVLSTFAVEESVLAYALVLYVQASSHVMMGACAGVALKSATVSVDTALSKDMGTFMTTFFRIVGGVAEALAPTITFLIFRHYGVLLASVPVIVLPTLALLLHVRVMYIELFFPQKALPQTSQ